jgi:hypothetical protein
MKFRLEQPFLIWTILAMGTVQVFGMRFDGTVMENGTFKKDIGQNLEFQVRGDGRGRWTVHVVSKTDPHEDHTSCGPLHGSSACEIGAEDFTPAKLAQFPDMKRRPFKIGVGESAEGYWGRVYAKKIRGIVEIKEADFTVVSGSNGRPLRHVAFSVEVDPLPAGIVRFSTRTFAGTVNAGESFTEDLGRGLTLEVRPAAANAGRNSSGWSVGIEPAGLICLPLHGCNNCMIDPICTAQAEGQGKGLRLPMVRSVDIGLDEPDYSFYSDNTQDPNWTPPTMRVPSHDKVGILEFTITDLKAEDADAKDPKGSSVAWFSKMSFKGVVKFPQ